MQDQIKSGADLLSGRQEACCVEEPWTGHDVVKSQHTAQGLGDAAIHQQIITGWKQQLQ